MLEYADPVTLIGLLNVPVTAIVLGAVILFLCIGSVKIKFPLPVTLLGVPPCADINRL